MLTVHRVVLYGIFLFFWPAERWVNFYSIFFFFLGGGWDVGSRREFFGFRPNKIIPITSGNPEYPPHPWSQASRLYTFTTFSLKTITANTAVAFIREAYLTQEVHSWTRISVAKVLLQSIILRYIYIQVVRERSIPTLTLFALVCALTSRLARTKNEKRIRGAWIFP